MKRYITTITLNVWAESEEEAVKSANLLCKRLHNKTGNNAEIEDIQEFRLNGWGNRKIDFHRIHKENKENTINFLTELES